MVNSETLQRSLGAEDFECILKICKDAEAIGEPTEKDLCAIRKDIETVKSISSTLDPNINPTAILYLERLLHCLQMKNSELGEVYNHIEYLYEFNNARPSVKSARFSQYAEERKSMMSSFKSPGGNKESADKKIMRRQFYEICEKIIRAMRSTKPNVFYANKGKMFNYVLEREVPVSDWKATVDDLLSDPNNNWIYTDTEKEIPKKDNKESLEDYKESLEDDKEIPGVDEELQEDNKEQRSEDKEGEQMEYNVDDT
jgi:hypothetical protein